MVVTLRSGRKIERNNEENKKNTEIVEGEEIGTENKLSSSVEVEATRKEEVQNEQQEEVVFRGSLPMPGSEVLWLHI